MKRIKSCYLLIASVIVGAATLVSCGSDDGASYTFTNSEVVLTSEKGASSSFGISFEDGEGEWAVTQVPDFVTVYPNSGSGSGTIRVTAIGNNNSKQPYEGVIAVEVNGSKAQTIRVVQQNLDQCYTEPANVLLMCDGLAFNWDFGRNTKYYYWEIFTQSDYSRMSENEVLKKVATGKVDDRVLPDNDDYACVHHLDDNTQYVIVTVSYAEGDRQGDVVVTPLSTKSTKNQPEADINDVEYYKDNSGNYFYGWNVKRNTYCREYYTYAAASPSYFWVFYLLNEGAYPMIAWLMKNEIMKDGEDHSTSMNSGFSNYPFNNGRDQFYAPQVENGVSYFTAFPNTDKYFLVLTWGTGASGDLSGIINAEWYDFTKQSSNVSSGMPVKAITPQKVADGPQKLIVNAKDIKLTRIK